MYNNLKKWLPGVMGVGFMSIYYVFSSSHSCGNIYFMLHISQSRIHGWESHVKLFGSKSYLLRAKNVKGWRYSDYGPWGGKLCNAHKGCECGESKSHCIVVVLWVRESCDAPAENMEKWARWINGYMSLHSVHLYDYINPDFFL